MKALIDLFRVPSAKALAQRQIEESERQWVKHLEASEYHQAMMRYHTDVVRQLKARENIMTVTQLWVIGALCAVMAIIWLGDLFFSAPEEDFDKDLSKEDQEAEALGVVDSMRRELEYLRKDGLL